MKKLMFSLILGVMLIGVMGFVSAELGSSWILKSDGQEPMQCRELEGSADNVYNLAGEVCFNNRIIEYYDNNSDKVIFVHLTNYSKGFDLMKEYLSLAGKPSSISENIYTLELAELFWVSNKEYNIIGIQEGRRIENDGGFSYSYGEAAKGDSSIFAEYVQKYPPIKFVTNPPTSTCSDSDGGKNYLIKGVTTGLYWEDTVNKGPLNYYDGCSFCDGNMQNCKYVSEYFCRSDGKVDMTEYACPNGCGNGVCLADSYLTMVELNSDFIMEKRADGNGFNTALVGGTRINVLIKEIIGGNKASIEIYNKDKMEGQVFSGIVGDKFSAFGYTVFINKVGSDFVGLRVEKSSSEIITEQITCYFVDSEKEQKCYLAGSFTDEDKGTKFCYGVDTCTIKFSGYKGEEVTWKSSCGGYDYTTVDGVDNNIDFDCANAGGESNETEIKNTWFKYAYWQCYDGTEQKSNDDTSCKSSGTWQKYAKEFCDGHCYGDGSKCGVNSFSISGECYGDEVEVPVEEPGEWPVDFEGEVLICKDSCALKDKCYPFGYRKDGKFCSDETNFVEYSGSGDSCENNFECGSNLCIDSECVKEGLWKRFTKWFKKFF